MKDDLPPLMKTNSLFNFPSTNIIDKIRAKVTVMKTITHFISIGIILTFDTYANYFCLLLSSFDSILNTNNPRSTRIIEPVNSHNNYYYGFASSVL